MHLAQMRGNSGEEGLCNQREWLGDFLGDPIVETLPANAGGAGLTLGWETKNSTCLLAKKPKHKVEAIL